MQSAKDAKSGARIVATWKYIVRSWDILRGRGGVVFERGLTAGYYPMRESARFWSNRVLDKRKDDLAEWNRTESVIII